MESVLGRYRNLTILVGVLFLQVLGLAVQVKRSTDAEHTRLIRIWAVDAITPFERIVVQVQNGWANLWHEYFYLRGVRAENRQLKEEIEQMRLEQVRLNEDAEQAHRLQSLLAFKEQYIAKTLAAQVIGSCASDLSRCIYIDKGSNDGIKSDMAVITAKGIVGKTLKVYDSSSQVLMINDQSSGVGVLLEKSRLQGVLRGTATGELALERVMSDEQVAPGEIVLSSGGDQIFPKGLPVGVVTRVSPGREMFLDIKVKPAADLSRLEEVLVVTEKQEHQPVAESSGKVRAADILAQRLPSVPDKPANSTSQLTPEAGTAVTHAPGVARAKPQVSGNTQSVASKPVAGSLPAPGSTATQKPTPTSPTAAQSATIEPSKKAVSKLASTVQLPASDASASRNGQNAQSDLPTKTPPAKPPATAQPPGSEETPH
jgi:rod shape-determining protein MreC